MFSKIQSWSLVMLASAGVVSGQEAPPKNEEDRGRWMEVYAKEAAMYQMFRHEGEAIEELKLQPAPILTYTNPIRVRDTHGGAFVWTSDGRPEVVGTIWSVVSPDDSTRRWVSHEFHSLSLVPLSSKHEPRVGQRGPVPDWTTSVAGIEPQRIKSAPDPVKSANLRLTQMRRLSKRFKVIFPPGQGDAQGSLRLLVQPVYRYQSEQHQIIDGAVFAFAMGTDPELILIIEAAESADGTYWTFAAAPMTNLSLALEYENERVWECPRAIPFVGDRTHFMYWGVSERDGMLK